MHIKQELLLGQEGRAGGREGSRQRSQMADGAQAWPGISAVRGLGSLPTASRLQPPRCWGDISLGWAVVAGGGSGWDAMLSSGAAQLTAAP